mgnify:CR=1 FL=1
MISGINQTEKTNTHVSEPVNNEKKQKKDGKLREGLSIFAALGSTGAINSIYNSSIAVKLDNNLKKIEAQSSQYNNMLSSAGYLAFYNSGLKTKGVKMPALDIIQDIYNCEVSKIPFKGIFQRKKQKKICNSIKRVLDGTGALYKVNEKHILVNMDRLPAASFHEMGHALNYNSVGIGKLLAKLRPIGGLANLFLAVAVLRKPKAEGEESETRIGRGLDFIKKNCTTLSALSLLPLVLEEGLASIKGIKLAKGLLNEPAMKSMKRVCGAGWLTYFGAAVSSVLAVYAADKVRNKTAQKG